MTTSTAPTQAGNSAPAKTERQTRSITLLPYLAAGMLFGFALIKAEVVSWYRIQEMFRFQSFHMYGVIGLAVIVGAISVALIKASKAKSVTGETITLAPKAPTYVRYITGGTAFGLGWALIGACPGPIFALIGSGMLAMVVVLIGALIGTFVYGLVRSRLPH